jgi:hypothetical protein
MAGFGRNNEHSIHGNSQVLYVYFSSKSLIISKAKTCGLVGAGAKRRVFLSGCKQQNNPGSQGQHVFIGVRQGFSFPFHVITALALLVFLDELFKDMLF